MNKRTLTLLLILASGIPLCTSGIENAATQNPTQLLFDAIKAGNNQQVKQALQAGADIRGRAQKNLNRVQPKYLLDGYTPLMKAVACLADEVILAQKTLNAIKGSSLLALGTAIPTASAWKLYDHNAPMATLCAYGIVAATGVYGVHWFVKECKKDAINERLAVIYTLLGQPRIKMRATAELGTVSAFTLLNDLQRQLNNRMFSLFGFKTESEFATILDALEQVLQGHGARVPMVKRMFNTAIDHVPFVAKQWLHKRLDAFPLLFEGL